MGQPSWHTPQPTQPGALREMKSPSRPSFSAPRLKTSELCRAISGPIFCTSSARSTSSNKGASFSGVHGEPKSRSHSRSTRSGARKQMALLMNVLPPTARPAASGISTFPLPTITLRPA